MKKIVHICNNYVASKVHMELISSISKKNREQCVFVPIRHKDHQNINILKDNNVKFKYFKYLHFLRFFPILKIMVIFFAYVFFGNRSKNDYVIAHNFWTDGMVAYLNNLFFDIPYSLVVRNTDMNVFLPKLKHYHWLMRLMVDKSDGLVFINNIYMKDFYKKYPKIFNKSKKNTIIYNGVNSFWLRSHEDMPRSNTLIYVGGFNGNKNIIATIKAAEIVKKDYSDLELLLVGGSEAELKNLTNIKEIPSYIKVLGKIDNKDYLRSLYLKSKVFIMPSFFETFGLVYIEALLQGCSVICTKGQGIDGVFNNNSIRAVDPKNIDQIAMEIKDLLRDFELNKFNEEFYKDLINRFDWNEISNKYLDLIE